MFTQFNNKRISGLLTILPEKVVSFDEEAGNYTFSIEQTMRLKKIMGFRQHCIAKKNTATSDLCVYGLQYLLQEGKINKDEIGAVVVASLTPDHFVPHVSNIIQAKCGLSTDVLCIDILQGCSAYVLGLLESFMLLNCLKDKKVLLFNADVLSHKVSPRDRNSYPIVGDGATISVIENTSDRNDVFVNFKMDGSRSNILVIPAGGSRMPCSHETGIMTDDGTGNLRSLDNIVMEGTDVLHFAMTEVPEIIEDTLGLSRLNKTEIDYFVCHQPNRFVLEKLADRLEIPYEKMPMNLVENYGNTSGASVPMVMTLNLTESLKSRSHTYCLTSFGSGMSWGSIIMQIGNLDFCETLTSDL